MEPSLRYEQVAGQLREQISRGALSAGEKVPSVRLMSRQSQVSIATVIQAYAQLEAQGLIEVRPQSGYYVRGASVPQIGTRAPTRLRPRPRPIANSLLGQVFDIAARDNVLPLHLAAPDPQLLPMARLAALTREVLKQPEYLRAGYLHPAGLPALRHQVARRLALAGTTVDPEDVVITAGAMEALSLSLQVLTQPGDLVLVETPTYYGLLQAIKARQLKVIEIPNHCCSGIDVECALRVLAEQPVKVAILTPSFNNPNGALTPAEARQTLVAACVQRGIAILEDDVYADLSFSGAHPPSLYAYANGGPVILCGSVSKTISPGMRIGWAVSPRWREALVQAKAFHSCGAPTINQFVIAQFLECVSMDRNLRRLRAVLASNMHRFSASIARHWPAGTKLSRPAGGLSLWVELPGDCDARAVFEAGVAAGIGSMPGSLFSAGTRYRNFLRLSCGLPWSAQIEQALRTLGQIVAELDRAR